MKNRYVVVTWNELKYIIFKNNFAESLLLWIENASATAKKWGHSDLGWSLFPAYQAEGVTRYSVHKKNETLEHVYLLKYIVTCILFIQFVDKI